MHLARSPISGRTCPQFAVHRPRIATDPNRMLHRNNIKEINHKFFELPLSPLRPRKLSSILTENNKRYNMNLGSRLFVVCTPAVAGMFGIVRSVCCHRSRTKNPRSKDGKNKEGEWKEACEEVVQYSKKSGCKKLDLNLGQWTEIGKSCIWKRKLNCCLHP